MVEVDCSELECFEFEGTGNTEMRVSNWFGKTMTSVRIFSSTSFLFIQDFLNMAS